MPRVGPLALAFLVLALIGAGSAQGAALVFVKKNDVWLARPDGSGQIRVTRDGTRANPYYSPSIADNGTIVALKGIHLHSFRPGGARIVRPRQWAVDPTPTLSTEPFSVDLSPNGKVVATDNALYSTYYDPRVSEDRPEFVALFVDFLNFRTNKDLGLTDSFYNYWQPAWIDAKRVIVTSGYGIFDPQVIVARVGRRTRGTAFYRDPERDPATNTNAFVLMDAELTRDGSKFAVMRRPLQLPNLGDLRPRTIQIYRTGKPSTASTPLCAIGPGRKIDEFADPSWSPDGKTLYWWERGRGIFSTRVTAAPGCGLKPRRIIRGGLTPDLSRATAPRRHR